MNVAQFSFHISDIDHCMNNILLIHLYNIFRFDSLFIQSMLLEMEITDIKSLNCGSGLLEIHLPQFNISFMDSMRYIPGSLKKMAERFKLPVKKGMPKEV